MIIVDGVDPGITRKSPTGVASNLTGELQVGLIAPRPGVTGFPRVAYLVDRVMGPRARRNDPRIVIVEADAIAAKPAPTLQQYRDVLWWEWASRHGVSVLFLRPPSLKLILTGHGRASKEDMIEAASQLVDEDLTDDAADAVGLWVAGMVLCGYEVGLKLHDKQIEAVHRNLTLPEHLKEYL